MTEQIVMHLMAWNINLQNTQLSSHLCLQQELKVFTKTFSTSGDKALELCTP